MLQLMARRDLCMPGVYNVSSSRSFILYMDDATGMCMHDTHDITGGWCLQDDEAGMSVKEI